MSSHSRQLLSDRLAALLITYNEENNIERTLLSIAWMPHVLIIDSGSDDRTLSIVSQFHNTTVLYRKFDSFANQCNFGLEHLSSDWVLSLDADYVLTPQLTKEIIDRLSDNCEHDNYMAYRIGFRYCINGKPIYSGLLPPRTCLYQRKSAHYIDIGHGHKVIVNGRTGQLYNKIYHDDRKTFAKWLETQQKYQKTEANMLRTSHSGSLPIQDLLRKHTFLAPFFAFFMCLVMRRGLLDGREGIIYAFHRLIAESLLYMYMHGYKE
ncbi:MAG: glycosyltransferase family 2 protein [Cyanobacteriota bacterium]